MKEDKKIKILFRHRSMEMGGVEKVMLGLLNNLSREKFEITACINLHQGELRDEFPKDIRTVFLAKGKEDFSQNSFLQKIQLFKRKILLERYRKNPHLIDDKFLKENYDIEIAMTYNDFEFVLNSSNKNSKKVGWFHSEIQVPKLQPLVPKILEHFPQFDHMVYCSQKIKDIMHQYYPNLNYPAESVIINAIPIEEIKEKANQKIDFPFEETERVPSFVSVGRLHSRKGYHRLIEAHSQLLNDGCQHKIIIVGEGEERKNLEKLSKEKNVENSFILVGNQMNPYPFIKNADFFILPSESEAWPLVIAEALILQKPTIATDTGDVSKMIDDRKTGYLINYSTDEMYQALKEFLTNDKLIAEIHENLKNVEEKFDNQKIFNEVEEILINLVKN